MRNEQGGDICKLSLVVYYLIMFGRLMFVHSECMVRVSDYENSYEPLMKFGNFKNYEKLILIKFKNQHYERIQCDMTESIMDFNTGTTFVEFLTSDQHSYCV